MRRLYLKIYLAVLAALLVFALAAGALWRLLPQDGQDAHEWGATLARNVLPPAAAPAGEQQAALERISANLNLDLALYSASRERIASVGEAPPAPAARQARSGWARHWGGRGAYALRLDDGRWLVTRMPAVRRGPSFGVAALVVLLLAIGAGAYPVVRRLTMRLERLQAGVESLGAGNLSARVEVRGDDEVARLARSFNRAAGRIEELLGAHRSLLANASHELRTPLARIRLAVELMKQDANPERRRDLEQDIAELDALIDEILLSSRLDATAGPDPAEELDLLALAAEECARYDAVELDGESVSVRGDARLLRRMLRNLIDNALRHGKPPVAVRVARNAGNAEIRVQDAGPGVPPEERERVFEPFYRRAASTAGAGLGLALVRQIARRHGGEARCEAGFVVRLPSN